MHFSELNILTRRSWQSEGAGNVAPKRGVLLINLGTPGEPTAASVRRYLGEFLADPAVIQLPRGLGFLNTTLGKTIAKFRAKHSAALYRSIWTDDGSPLLTITNAQVEALQDILPSGWRVYGAMRYGTPSIPEVLERIERDGVDEVVIVPMYPQYSGPTTGTAMRVVYDYLADDDHTLQVTTRLSWYNDHGYVAAQSERLKQYAHAHNLTPDNTFLLFSTHGLPVSYVQKGDPYPEHVAETVSLVAKRMGWARSRWSLAFQSRMGPAAWLQPYTDEVLENLSTSGEKKLLVCPISFVTDCLETLEEIDQRYRKPIEQNGTELYLCPALNTFGPFIAALKHLVLQGCSAMSHENHHLREVTHASYKADPKSDRTDSLVMVGASIEGRLGCGEGPKLSHVDADTLRRLKRPACAIPEFLREVRESCDLQEAFLWNTCHRFELYGIRKEGDRDQQATSDAIRAKLMEGVGGEESQLNVLFADEAKHHLWRTASGLNSCLPGERDVLDQLQAAQRLAERANTGGKLVQDVIREALDFERSLRTESPWGDFSPDYAQIALQFVTDRVKADLGKCRILVIGGSTTSAAVLRTLTGHLGVSSKQLTLIYRGHKHGGHLKLLRKAIRQGQRIRVQNYEEKIVDRAIAGADVVIFGVDREEPLLDRARLQACRGEAAKPLTVIDFNMYGSTRELRDARNVQLFTLTEIDKAVRAGAEAVCQDDGFQKAVTVAERRIAEAIAHNSKTMDRGEMGTGQTISPVPALASSQERSLS